MNVLSLLASGMLALAATAVHAEQYQIPAQAPAPAATADAPKVAALGPVQIGTTSVPAYLVTLVDGAEGWNTPTAPSPLRVQGKSRLKPADAAQLAAFLTPAGWLLAPRGWTVRKGGVGADGSVSLVIAPPTGPGYLSYYNPSACLGCALTEASAFFPAARAQAKAQDFTTYEGTATALQRTPLGKHTLAWRTTVEGQLVDGLAWFDGDSDLPYFKLQVALPPAQHGLATPILNWRLPAAGER